MDPCFKSLSLALRFSNYFRFPPQSIMKKEKSTRHLLPCILCTLHCHTCRQAQELKSCPIVSISPPPRERRNQYFFVTLSFMYVTITNDIRCVLPQNATVCFFQSFLDSITTVRDMVQYE